MRFSIFEVVLPLATVFAISVSGLSKEQDLGSNFEKQLILVESDLEPIGKLATQNVLPVYLCPGNWYIFYLYYNFRCTGYTRLKISEHQDGYSLQAKVKGYFMRVRFTNADNSIYFNIEDNEGSIKFTKREFFNGLIL